MNEQAIISKYLLPIFHHYHNKKKKKMIRVYMYKSTPRVNCAMDTPTSLTILFKETFFKTSRSNV